MCAGEGVFRNEAQWPPLAATPLCNSIQAGEWRMTIACINAGGKHSLYKVSLERSAEAIGTRMK